MTLHFRTLFLNDTKKITCCLSKQCAQTCAIPAPINPPPITVTFFIALWFEEVLKREDIGGKVLRSAWLLRSCLTGDFTAVTIRQEAITITVQVSGSCEGTENELHVSSSEERWLVLLYPNFWMKYFVLGMCVPFIKAQAAGLSRGHSLSADRQNARIGIRTSSRWPWMTEKESERAVKDYQKNKIIWATNELNYIIQILFRQLSHTKVLR